MQRAAIQGQWVGGRGERRRKREGVGGTQGDRWGIGHHKVSHARVRKDRAGATRGLRLGRPGHTLTVGRGAQGRAHRGPMLLPQVALGEGRMS